MSNHLHSGYILESENKPGSQEQNLKTAGQQSNLIEIQRQTKDQPNREIGQNLEKDKTQKRKQSNSVSPPDRFQVPPPPEVENEAKDELDESNVKENLAVASRVEVSNYLLSTPNISSIGHLERNRLHGLPSKQYEMLDMEENQIIDHFASYVMNVYDLPHLGFPQESSRHPGKAYIYIDPVSCQMFNKWKSSESNNNNDQNCVRCNKTFLPGKESPAHITGASLAPEACLNKCSLAVKPWQLILVRDAQQQGVTCGQGYQL